MAGFSNDVMYADNVNFTGLPAPAGKLPTVTLNGQLLIGSTASPNIRVGTLTQGAGISITNGAGSITIATDGSTVGNTITGNTGGALNPVAGNWNILGTSTNGIQSAGSGNTLTVRMQSPYADGDFNFQSTVSGQTRTLTIENTSNTASSAATQLIRVAGTTAANPYTQWAVGTTRAWGLGIENAASQRLTLSMDAAGTVTPGGGNYIFSATPGATSFLSSFTFWVPEVGIGGLNRPGAAVALNVNNGDTTAGSDANIQLNTSATGGGMPYVSYSSLGNNWWHGVDKTSSSNTFRFQYGNGGIFPALTNIITATTAGEINFPLTPAFLGILQSANDNVTGAGTTFTLGSGTALAEIFDQSSDFNTNGTYTAPVAGKHYFCGAFNCLNLTAAMTFAQMQIVTSNRTYTTNLCNAAAMRTVALSADRFAFTMSVFTEMDAGDTATVAILITGGAGDTVDLESGNAGNYFSGFLQC